MKKLIIILFLTVAVFSYGMALYHDYQITQMQTTYQQITQSNSRAEKDTTTITYELNKKTTLRDFFSAKFRDVQKRFARRRPTQAQRVDTDKLVQENSRLSIEIERLKQQQLQSADKLAEGLKKENEIAKQVQEKEQNKEKFNLIALIGTIGGIAASISKIFELLGKLWGWLKKKFSRQQR